MFIFMFIFLISGKKIIMVMSRVPFFGLFTSIHPLVLPPLSPSQLPHLLQEGKTLGSFFFPPMKNNEIMKANQSHRGRTRNSSWRNSSEVLGSHYNNCISYGIWWSIGQNLPYFFKEKSLRLLPAPLGIS